VSTIPKRVDLATPGTDLLVRADDAAVAISALREQLDETQQRLMVLEEAVAGLQGAPMGKLKEPRPENHVSRLLIQAPRTNYSGVVVLDSDGGLGERVKSYTDRMGLLNGPGCFNKIPHPGRPGRYILTIPVFWRSGLWAIKPKEAALKRVNNDVFKLPAVRL